MDKLMIRAFLEYLTEKGDIENIAKLYEKYPELIEEDTVSVPEEQLEAEWEQLMERIEKNQDEKLS